MDASLPTGKELRLLSAKSMNSRLSEREILSNRGGSSVSNRRTHLER